jgi:diguanylate cyclase (GGDEF)-like protein
MNAPPASFPPEPRFTPEEQVDALIASAWALRHADPKGGLREHRHAYRRARDAGYVSGRAAALRGMGCCYNFLSAFRRAERLLRAAAVWAAQTAADRGLQAGCLKDLGTTHYLRSDYAAAVEFYRRALVIQQEIGDREGEGSSLNNIANVYGVLGDRAAAVECYVRALQCREETGNLAGKGIVLGNIAALHTETGQHDRARPYFEESLRISRETGDPRGECYSLNGLALNFLETGRPIDALRAGEEALRIARSVDDGETERSALLNSGLAYDRLGRFDEAAALQREALALARRVGDRSHEARALFEAGKVLLRRGDPDGAEESLRGALGVAEQSGEKKTCCEVHEALSEAAEARGDAAGALAAYKRFHALQKEIADGEVEMRTRALLIQVEIEKSQKEVELHRLRNVELARMNAALKQADLEKSALLRRLERQVIEDALTGLYNRRHLENELTREFARSARHGEPLSVVLADIDHFKSINDGFSHQTGDEVLKTVAGLLRRTCRATDVVARYGGEEFALVLPQTAARDAALVCEKVRRAVEGYDWDALRPGLRVTVSLGVSDDLANAAHHEQLLSFADARLYEAKRGGRNRVCS